MDGRKINEGPAILVNEEKGKLFIVYSCNPSWTKNYRLAWLMLDMNDGDPMNPADWQKSSNYAFWRCDNTKEPVSGVNGLGHCTFTKSPDGNRGLDRLTTPCATPTAAGASVTPSSRNSRGTPTEPPISGREPDGANRCCCPRAKPSENLSASLI